MKILGIIPARYGSSRFPGKPLAKIRDKPMVQWVYERSQKAESLDELVVATDDKRIQQAVEEFDGQVLMTSREHKSGTERCAEALEKVQEQFDLVINIQGDEPLIMPSQVDQLVQTFDQPETEIATLVKVITKKDKLFDDTVMKVAVNQQENALYFSRNVIPYIRDTTPKQWLKSHTFYKHIGIYGYRAETLQEIARLSPTPLEQAEGLEQLRWLEHGYSIRVAETEHDGFSVDTPEDLEQLEQKHFSSS